MFAEELKGNVSRKRAEENKGLRKKIKEQQLKQEKVKAASAVATANSVNSSSAEGVTTSSSAFVSPSNGLVTTPVFSASKPPDVGAAGAVKAASAVERANEQRLLRAETALQRKSAVKIQSIYRSHHSNVRLATEQKNLLCKRLSDMATLRVILQKKMVVTEYVPPPATTTSLMQQFAFISSTIPYKNRCARIDPTPHIDLWERLLEFCLLPSLVSKDDNLNPFLVWTETSHGQRRCEDVIRLALLAVVSNRLSIDGMKSTLQFLRLLILKQENTAREERAFQPRSNLVLHFRKLLLGRTSTVFPVAPDPVKIFPFSIRGSSLDLIAILRYYLMFVVAGPRPIPADVVDLREKIVSEPKKIKAGNLTLLVLDAVECTMSDTERDLLRTRFVLEILTVPLFPWKIPSDCFNHLVARSKDERKIPLINLLEALVDLYAEDLSNGLIGKHLPDDEMPLKMCPATKSQCLLANLVQLVQAAPSINTSDANTLNPEAGALCFSVIGTLLDNVPLGTFSSRDSVVEWVMDGKGVHTPIVLSPIILDQCRLIVLDSFVRRIFNCSIDLNALDTQNVLSQRNEKDLKHEKDLLEEGASSAALLAAKEARVDRTEGFWNSSKWARKLTTKVTSLLAGENPSKKKSDNGHFALHNTTSVSRKLASGNADACHAIPVHPQGASPNQLKQRHYSPDFFFAVCRTYAILVARWGGDGHSDMVKRAAAKTSDGSEIKVASSKPEPCVLALLNVLCFSTPIVQAAWGVIQSNDTIISEVYSIIDASKGKTLIRGLNIRPVYGVISPTRAIKRGFGASLLYLFTCTLSHVLIITDDVEIHDMNKPLPVHQLRRCIQALKKLLYRACCLDGTSVMIESNYFGLALIASSSKTMRDLYDRSSRRPLCVPKLWLVSGLLEDELKRCRSHSDYVQLLSLPVLRVSPFLVSFKRRLKLFERIITTNRIDVQGVNDGNPFNSNPLKPGIPVRIARGRLLEDGLATMNHLGTNMRLRIAVQYVNEAGARETGIDAGGLFKEFWTDLSAIAFDPNYALFKVAEGAGNCLYPNPSSGAAHGSDHIILFEFLGRILGKALYEGITIHPRFAHFFLSFLRGDYNFLHMLPDLSTIDPQLYNNLMFLKTYDGDAEDLCLTFTVTIDDFGGTTEIPLIPNGSNVEVNNTNKQRYIGLVAKYYVFDRVKEQSEAFTKGLWDVIDRSWLRLFNEPELQVLISGASEKIDVDDMRAHTKYAGGYTSIDRTISRFWSVVGSLSEKQQAELLRFVTSCERPPPLGFSSMNPPFTIQRVGILRDGDLLPTSSTCFNTLKLPTYSSEKVMKDRLLYAIQSGAGFELT